MANERIRIKLKAYDYQLLDQATLLRQGVADELDDLSVRAAAVEPGGHAQ